MEISPNPIQPGVECIECGKCIRNCPMDIGVLNYVRQKKPVTSTKCARCMACVETCPVKSH